MLEKGKITPAQATFLLMFSVLATANFNLPAIAAAEAKMDAWMTPLVATIPGLILAVIMAKLAQMFPGLTLTQYIQLILGKYIGWGVGIAYLLWLVWTNILIIRTAVDFIVTAFMPETPIEVFIAILIFLTAWGVRAGLEVLGRSASFLIPIFVGTFVLIFILLFHEMDFLRLTPVLEDGIKPVVKGSITPIAWRGEVVLMAFIWPYLNKPEQGLKATIWAVLAIGIILVFTSLGVTTIFGPLSAQFRFPTFMLARYVSVANFIERLDAIIMAVWIAGAFVKIGIFYYVSCLILGELLNLQEYQAIVYPLGIIQGFQTIEIAANASILVMILARVWPYTAFIFEYIIPIGILMVAFARGFHKKNLQLIVNR